MVAEFAVAVEVGPGLLGVSAPEHDREDLFDVIETGKLSIRQYCHL